MKIRLNDAVRRKIKRRSEVTGQVKWMLIARLNLPLEPEEIADDSPLFGAGLQLDSVDSLAIFGGLKEDFGIVLENPSASMFRSVNALVDCVLEHGKSG